jgi:hypothetical protein
MMAVHYEEIVRMRRQQEEAYYHAMRSQNQGISGLVGMGVGEMGMQQALRGQDPFAQTPEVKPEKNPKLLLLL